MKLVLGKWAVDRVAAGFSPAQAAQAAIDYLYARLGGHGGIILLDREGRIGLAHNTPRMAWGLQTVNGMQVGVTRNGLKPLLQRDSSRTGTLKQAVKMQ